MLQPLEYLTQLLYSITRGLQHSNGPPCPATRLPPAYLLPPPRRPQRVQLQPHLLIPPLHQARWHIGRRRVSPAARRIRFVTAAGSKIAATGWRRTPDPVADGKGAQSHGGGRRAAGAEGEDSPPPPRRDWEEREMQPRSPEFITLKLPIEP